MKNTYLEPRYVLVTPLNTEDHERRLRERGIYSEDQINTTLSRTDMYVRQNQDHPGFFDMMICSGKENLLSCVCRKLFQLILWN